MKYLSEEDEQHVAEEMQGPPASEPPVRSSALLAALVESEKDAWQKIDEAAVVVQEAHRKLDTARDEWARQYAALKSIEREQAANGPDQRPATKTL
jgi:hypothetical protein